MNTHVQNMTQLCRSFTGMQWIKALANSTGVLRTSNSLWGKDCVSLDTNVSLSFMDTHSLPIGYRY